MGLGSLVGQSLATDQYEILIVNNNSSDNSASIIQSFIEANPQLPARYIFEGQQGLSFARNRGIAEAKGDIITFIDDDALLAPDFLEVIYNYMTTHDDVAGVGGKIIPKYEIARPKWMNKYLEGLVTKVDYGDQVVPFPKNRFPVGCNMTYRKKLLVDSGGFNTLLKWRADDKQIFHAVKELNDKILYLPTAWLEHMIDEERTTDERFIAICRKTGDEEQLRVRSIGLLAYWQKIVEYLFKFAGSFLLAIGYTFKGQPLKGKYILLYRYHALKGMII